MARNLNFFMVFWAFWRFGARFRANFGYPGVFRHAESESGVRFDARALRVRVSRAPEAVKNGFFEVFDVTHVSGVEFCADYESGVNFSVRALCARVPRASGVATRLARLLVLFSDPDF